MTGTVAWEIGNDPGMLQNDFAYMKDKCTHQVRWKVCPKTLADVYKGVADDWEDNNFDRDPDNDIDYCLVPYGNTGDPTLPRGTNCINWACQKVNQGGIDFPLFIDPYGFCNDKDNGVEPR